MIERAGRMVLVLVAAVLSGAIVVVASSNSEIAAATAAGKTRVISRQPGPCDIYASAHMPCVAAHSMVRALYATYNGPSLLCVATA